MGSRKSLFDYMLLALAWLTIVVGPLFFFLLTQWRFLPYQDGSGDVGTPAVRSGSILLCCGCSGHGCCKAGTRRFGANW